MTRLKEPKSVAMHQHLKHHDNGPGHSGCWEPGIAIIHEDGRWPWNDSSLVPPRQAIHIFNAWGRSRTSFSHWSYHKLPLISLMLGTLKFSPQSPSIDIEQCQWTREENRCWKSTKKHFEAELVKPFSASVTSLYSSPFWLMPEAPNPIFLIDCNESRARLVLRKASHGRGEWQKDGYR